MPEESTQISAYLKLELLLVSRQVNRTDPTPQVSSRRPARAETWPQVVA